MAKARWVGKVMAACWIVGYGAANAWAALPSVADVLKIRPRQIDVTYSTPTLQEQEQCKLEMVTINGKNRGYMVRDPKGRPLRRFVDTTAKGAVDLWSYYLDGVEVYRDIYSSVNNNPVFQHRWLNTGGGKWGISYNAEGRIDTWKQISPEEVSQEVLQAVITKDLNRLKALWITDEEIASLNLAAAETTRMRDLRQQAPAKFQTVIAKLTDLGPQTKWERLESTGPQCIPGDQQGVKQDLFKFPRCMVLYENNGKHDWIQMGEMFQIGQAWRIIDAPATGDMSPGGQDNAQANDPALVGMLEQLRELDRLAPKGGSETPNLNTALVAYNLKRASVLQDIIAKVKADDKDQWIRQLADCLSAAAQSSADGDKVAYEKLQQLTDQIGKDQPASTIAGYVAFREMSADYAGKLAKPGPEFAKVQEQWLARLNKFVMDYPRAEDTADALLQMGMVSEFLGKEAEAKKCYQQLVSNFADRKPLADKAEGALRRLDLDGKSIQLTGATLGGGSFDITTLRGQVVIVYYWASWNQQSVGDFARLKLLLNTYGPKGVKLVCVNLDNSPPEANSALDRASVPGVQLFETGGLDSRLAVQYGIMVLPNMFLVGKDGNVQSRNVQLANLEDEIKKGLK